MMSNLFSNLAVIHAVKIFAQKLALLSFPPPIAHVYHPLIYAWEAHEEYLRRFANGQKKVLFLGMNAGPFGMMQTAVPFGEIAFVRDWMGIDSGVKKPDREHPKRPIEGFACRRSEVSGRRFWGLFRDRFGDAESFFKNHFVANYCPLGLLEKSGRNFTPNKLPNGMARDLEAICDDHLRALVKIQKPEYVIGVGAFAHKRAEIALDKNATKFGQILHPSPASPAANRDWKSKAESQMHAIGIW